jgi:hypothetical protein
MRGDFGESEVKHRGNESRFREKTYIMRRMTKTAAEKRFTALRLQKPTPFSYNSGKKTNSSPVQASMRLVTKILASDCQATELRGRKKAFYQTAAVARNRKSISFHHEAGESR